MNKNIITTGSQFSGYGSYLFALQSLNIEYKSLFCCDFDKYVKKTYLANHTTANYYDDATTTDWAEAPAVDLFISSPPCQAFSMAGLRKGTAESRGVLFKYTYEYIKAKKPRFFIIENVPGLLSIEGGQVFKNWLKLLACAVNGGYIQGDLFNEAPESCGYYVRWNKLNAKEVGHPAPIPHNRDRVFIVGFREKEDYKKFKWPKKKKLKKFLIDFLDEKVKSKYFLVDSTIKRLIGRLKRDGFKPKISPEIAGCLVAQYSKNPTDGTYIEVKNNTSTGFIKAYEGDGVRLDYPGSKYKRGRVQKKVSPSLLTGQDCGVVVNNNNLKIRKLTPNECRKLMGLPDNFIQPNSNTQAYKQYGNSIAVNVLAAIFKNLLK